MYGAFFRRARWSFASALLLSGSLVGFVLGQHMGHPQQQQTATHAVTFRSAAIASDIGARPGIPARTGRTDTPRTPSNQMPPGGARSAPSNFSGHHIPRSPVGPGGHAGKHTHGGKGNHHPKAHDRKDGKHTTHPPTAYQ